MLFFRTTCGENIRYEGLVFDFDGTLVNSLDVAIDEMIRLSKYYGFRKIHRSESDRLKSLSAQEIISDLKIKRWLIPFIATHLRFRLYSRRKEISFQPGIIEALDTISGRCRMALVTSSSRSMVEYLLEERIKYFEPLYCGLAPFGKSSKLTAFDIKKYIYIGDEVRDIKACQRVGLPVAAVTWGYNSRQRLLQEKPDKIVDSPAEMMDLVL